MFQNWFRRLLSLCPVLILVLWVAGIAHFRNYGLQPIEWATLLAVAFALQILARRLRPQRPMPPLPKGSNPVTLAAMAAAIIALLAALVGGVLEWVVQEQQPSNTSWGLRTTWHAACSFGASYCGFLLRLTTLQKPPLSKR